MFAVLKPIKSRKKLLDYILQVTLHNMRKEYTIFSLRSLSCLLTNEKQRVLSSFYLDNTKLWLELFLVINKTTMRMIQGISPIGFYPFLFLFASYRTATQHSSNERTMKMCRDKRKSNSFSFSSHWDSIAVVHRPSLGKNPHWFFIAY